MRLRVVSVKHPVEATAREMISMWTLMADKSTPSFSNWKVMVWSVLSITPSKASPSQ